MFKKIIKYSRDKTKKYIYAYYTEPDCLLHEFGNNTKEVIDCIKMLNDKSKEYIEKLENSLVIITSDHGHTDIEYYYLEDYPDVQDLLENENKRLKSTLGDFFFLAKSASHLLFLLALNVPSPRRSRGRCLQKVHR